MAGGAFQTSREIFDNPIWTDVVKFRIFFYVYGNAVFSKAGTTVAGVYLKRGQFLRSYRNLANDLAYVEKRHQKKYSLNTIRNKIEQLVKEKRIKIESTDYGTLFTVVNYDEYQGFERYSKRMSDTATDTPSDTVREHQVIQQVNNNKNVKNDKKEEEGKPDSVPKQTKPMCHRYGEYKNVLLSDEQLVKLKTEFPTDWQERIERVSGYVQSTGKSYKDYLATIRNWARRDNNNDESHADSSILTEKQIAERSAKHMAELEEKYKREYKRNASSEG